MSGVHKCFGNVQAVNDVSINIVRGEIHAVLGENGAGKSTLMGILAGITRPDAGEIAIDGKVMHLTTRRDGALAGVGIVQQHFGLVADLNGVENYLLGHPDAGFWLHREAAEAQLRTTAQALGLMVDPTRKVEQLSIGERQTLEIVIALAAGARLLIMDEPTAALGSTDIDRLSQVLRDLADKGTSVIYISHKLEEVMRLADTVTVMRRGRVVASFSRGNYDTSRLTEAMIGSLPEREAFEPGQRGRCVASLKNVHVERTRERMGLHGLSVDVFAGEVLGVAGVLGNGQEALAEVLAELVQTSQGVIERQETAVAFIPEDRAKHGLAMTLTIAENSIVHRHGDRTLLGRWSTNLRGVADYVSSLVEQSEIQAGHHASAVSHLSGGNQQKLVVARELDRAPGLVVAHNPYRGLDVGAASAVRARLFDARKCGAGVVLLSPDLEDLFDSADRIVVLFDGRIIGELDPGETTPTEIGAMMAGAAR